MTIIKDDSSVISKLEASLSDDARVIIYDCHMFIVQATGLMTSFLYSIGLELRGCINYTLFLHNLGMGLTS